jgi:hypothetical protein
MRKSLTAASISVHPTPSWPSHEQYLHYDDDPDFTKWQIDTDVSIVGPQQEHGYQTVPIEVKSRLIL